MAAVALLIGGATINAGSVTQDDFGIVFIVNNGGDAPDLYPGDGQCSTDAFGTCKELQRQIGKAVDAAAAVMMIADAQCLIAHCP